MRIYLAHIPDFNAMMFPTGFAVVFSGLLLRMRNEAQLAGVIAHESRHFLAQAHDPQLARHAAQDRYFRDRGDGGRDRRRRRRASMRGDYVQLAQLGTILSLFKYSRTMEAEADAMGVRLIAEPGYAPDRDGRTSGSS